MAEPRKIVLVLSVLLAFSLILYLFLKWFDDPLRQARKISGLDIPSKSRLLHAEDTFSGAVNDGYVIYVFEVPPEFRPGSESECSRLGFTYGPVRVLPIKNFYSERYFDSQRVSCFRFDGNFGAWDLVVIQDDKIVVESANS